MRKANRKRGSRLLVSLVWGLAAGCLANGLADRPAQAENLYFVTENYPPFNYRDGSELKGSSIDTIRLMMKATGLSYTIEVMPWARALATATNQACYCVFTTVHNQERDQKFKWVEPLLQTRTLLIRKAGAPVAPGSLEEARSFRVGTQRADFAEALLKDNHFTKIDLASDLDLTMKKLLSGRIDLMPVTDTYFERIRREGVAVEQVLTLSENTYGIACNKVTPDALIVAMQASLEQLIANGSQARLFHLYGISEASKRSR